MAKEYIERGAVIEKQIGVVVYDEGGWDANVRAVPVEDIEAIPAADVVEVVHGRWIEVKQADYYGLRVMQECSCCGTKENWLANYCPNCGAKMRSDDE